MRGAAADALAAFQKLDRAAADLTPAQAEAVALHLAEAQAAVAAALVPSQNGGGNAPFLCLAFASGGELTAAPTKAKAKPKAVVKAEAKVEATVKAEVKAEVKAKAKAKAKVSPKRGERRACPIIGRSRLSLGPATQLAGWVKLELPARRSPYTRNTRPRKDGGSVRRRNMGVPETAL